MTRHAHPHALVQLVTLLIAGLSLLLWPLAVQAAIIPVTTVTPGVVDDTFCSLAEAIIAANTNSNAIEDNCPPGDDLPTDTVVLAAVTTYTLPVIFDSYAGPFGPVSVGLPAISSTLTISGNNAIIERRGSDLFGLLFISPTVGNLTTQDLTLRYGRSDHGGAIFNQGDVTLINTSVFSNTATNFGGAIYNRDQSTLTLMGSRVISNTSMSLGGGIYNVDRSTVALNGSHLIANRAGFNGGGIYNDSSGTITLVNSTVVSNSAAFFGGGIHNTNISTATLTSSFILSNTATLFGGGIYNNESTASLLNTTVATNTANFGGGIANDSNSRATLTNTTIISNTALGSGGGLANLSNSSAMLSGSTVVSNTARNNGGGIANDTGSSSTLVTSRVISNTARLLNGGGIFNSTVSRAILIDSVVLSNTAGLNGGGIASLGDSTTLLSNSRVVANRAVLNGGGITSLDSTAVLTDSTVAANRSATDGGGFANFSNSSTYLLNSLVGSNVASVEGGGIYDEGGSRTHLTNSTVVSNAASSGGGLASVSSTTHLTDSRILSNSAQLNGGGLFVVTGSTATITNSTVASNTSGIAGGGLYVEASIATVSNSRITANRSLSGGGLFNVASARAVLTNNHIAGNVSVEDGGAIFNESEQLEISFSRLLNNRAGVNGGAIASHEDYLIEQSCIVDNSDVALFSYTFDSTDARNNWWGTPDGPSGVGPGSGDSISTGIEFDPFLASAPLGCPNRTAEIGFSKRVTPAGNLLPGQPVTYTLTISNEGELNIYNIFVDDTLPTGFQLSQVITAGTTFTNDGDGYRLPNLMVGEVAFVQYIGKVDPALNADQLLTNTGILSQLITGILSASVSSNVVVPKLSWSSPAYSAVEGSGDFEATVVLSPTTPYTTVMVTATISGTTSGQAPQLLTFPATIGSQAVLVDVPPVDGALHDRLIHLGLQTPIHALLGNPISATLTVENIDSLTLTVSKHAAPSPAQLGEMVTYSYRITNTGTVTITRIEAFDDALGSLPELENGLTPQASAITTRSHVVVNEDLPGPLVNTVTVTGTDSFSNTIVRSAIVSVTLEGEPGLALSVTPSVTAVRLGEQISYTYRITNSGAVALTNVELEEGRFGISFDLGPLAPGATTIRIHTHTVVLGDLPGPILTDATVTGLDSRGNLVSAGAGSSVPIDRYETNLPHLERQPPGGVVSR